MEKKISIDYKDFKKNYNSKEPQLIILKFSSDFVDPVNSFMKISDDMETVSYTHLTLPTTPYV